MPDSLSKEPSEATVSSRPALIYMGALGSVALLCVVGQLLVQVLIARQEDDASVVNVSGRQRMLSQRITKSALAVAADREPEKYRAELRDASALWSESHDALIRRDPAMRLGGKNSETVLALYREIEEPRLQILSHAKTIAGQTEGKNATETRALVDEILLAEAKYLHGMDTIVFQYSREARGRVETLQRIQLGLLAVILAVLGFEALFVFRPAMQRIRMAVRQAQNSEAQHALVSGELGLIFDSVPALIAYLDTDGHILRLNRSGAEITGESLEALMGTCIYDLFTGQEARLRAEDLRIVKTGEPQLGLLHYLRNAQGDIRWLRMNKIPRKDASGEITGIVMFAVDVSEQKQIERQFMELRSEEQRRLSYNLHDGVGQELSGILYLGRRLVNRLQGRDPEAEGQAAEILKLVKRSVESVRDVSKSLRPIGDEPDALSKSLRDLTRTTAEAAGIDCAFEEKGTVLLFEADVAEHLYRIAQEAVNNAVRHSGARQIRVRLAQSDEETSLEVADDGRGMTGGGDQSAEGLGLGIMKHRAELIGGRLRIESGPQGGTTMQCTVVV